MRRPNLYDWLKVIAIITMIVDHLGYTFFPEISWLRLIGRIAFPIFLFLVGFNGSYKWRRDLFWLALIVQIPVLILGWRFHYRQPTLNILFGIIIGRIIVGLIDYRLKIKDYRLKVIGYRLKVLVPCFLFLVTLILLVVNPFVSIYLDYGSFVILFPLLGYIFRNYYKHRIFILLYSVFIFAVFGGFTQWIFNFSLAYLVVLIVFFSLLLCIFFVLGQQNRFLPVNKEFDKIIVWISQKALYLYVLHLVLFGIIKIFILWK